MESLEQEIAAFRSRLTRETAVANQLAAVRLACGVDMPDPKNAERADLERTIARISRAIQRERMKAARAHWSYDLNRHIALKQALDELRGAWAGNDKASAVVGSGACKNTNGARRRRQTGASGSALSVPRPYACVPTPSSSLAASGLQRSSVRPSDSSGRGPTSHDTGQA